MKITTGTADRAAALRAWPDVLRRYAEMEAEWERTANVVELTPERAAELAAGWAAWIAGDPARLERDGARALNFLDRRGIGSVWDAIRSADGRETRPEIRDRRLMIHAEEAARIAGLSVAANSVDQLKAALQPVVGAAYRDAERRDDGVVAATGAKWNRLAEARKVLPEHSAIPNIDPTVSLTGLFEGWKATTTVKARTVTETRYILDLLISHLGHEDASRIERADLAGWRDAMKADGRTNTTWNNRLSLVRQVLEWGSTEGRIGGNPADAKLRLKKQRTATRLPYTDAEVVQILQAARRETRPALRWAPWLMAFSGMRVGETLQLDVADVREDGGVWYLAVHEDDDTKSVKTGERRNVPLHPAVVADGFLDYVKSCPANGPLFPDKSLDQHGQRGGRGWNVTGRWVRETVGIKDPAKAPNHAFRHRMEDEMRAAEVPEDVRDAILGHARKTTGRLYGVRGEALKRLAQGLGRVPVPAGL